MKDRRTYYFPTIQTRTDVGNKPGEMKMLLFLTSYEEMKKLVDERVERLLKR